MVLDGLLIFVCLELLVGCVYMDEDCMYFEWIYWILFNGKQSYFEIEKFLQFKIEMCFLQYDL